MDLDSKGRVALVTGGSKGIGLAVVRSLAEEGAKVAAASRRRTAEFDAMPGEVLHVAVDLSDAKGPEGAVRKTIEEFGQIDILINNAGGPPAGVTLPRFGFLGLSDSDWQEMLNFNLLSAVRACRAALPHFASAMG